MKQGGGLVETADRLQTALDGRLVAVFNGPAPGVADIAQLRLHGSDRLSRLGTVKRALVSGDLIEIVIAVSLGQLLPAINRLAGDELVQQLVQLIATIAPALQQRHIEQAGHRQGRRAGNGEGSFQAEGAAKDRELGQGDAVTLRQQLPGISEYGGHALVPARSILRRQREEIEIAADLAHDGRRVHHPRPGGGQLQGQRRALHEPADLQHGRDVLAGHLESRIRVAGGVDKEAHRAVSDGGGEVLIGCRVIQPAQGQPALGA